MTDISTGVTVRQATRGDAEGLISVLAEAFFDGPVADWLVPDPNDRRTVYQRYFELALNHGLDNGHVDTTADLSAVAIWYPRTDPEPQNALEYSAAMEAATGVYAPKFTLLDTMFEAFHPSEPHHYLAYVAVNPEQQNRGIGAALLSHHHRQLDALGMPAYLEASNLRNRELYVRLGYRAGPPMILPTTGPTIWRMWRGQPNTPGPVAFPKSRPLPRRRPLRPSQ
ncbi:GNAT family N-acetyltransferase [Micromonospora sp. DH14]|uniref:GNAT family N-acetyltransferase n=1 Tax=Micromonospora sp. DH14 TaxID=3040120 RepID=UPI002443557C|nr:GNAT family N-acetyltransferase [Micromonospora sp. DH14]MDG9674684.1 GNAT family N-acetyltransferase [Micromonospora sp. DH14]